MKMRTTKQFWRELREADPNCAVGLGHIRQAVATGVIPSFQVGRRRVFDADTALDHLFAGHDAGHQCKEVRRVD